MRYLLFRGWDYEADGGMDDWIANFPTLEGAVEGVADLKYEPDWAQVVYITDDYKLKIVARYDYRGWSHYEKSL